MLTTVLASMFVSALTSIGVLLIGRAMGWPRTVAVGKIETKDPDRWMDNILAKSHPPRDTPPETPSAKRREK